MAPFAAADYNSHRKVWRVSDTRWWAEKDFKVKKWQFTQWAYNPLSDLSLNYIKKNSVPFGNLSLF